MTRLLTVSILVGLLAAAVVALEVRETVASAAEAPLPGPAQESGEHLIAAAEGMCSGSGGTWVRTTDGHECWPVEVLRAGPVVRRRR